MKNLIYICLGIILGMWFVTAIAHAGTETCTANPQFNRLECCVGDCNAIGADVTFYDLQGVNMYPKYNPKLGGWQIVWGNGQVAHSTVFKTAEDAEQVINKCTF